MAKRTVYLYRDKNVCIVPTAKVSDLKKAAEAVFIEYRRHKCNRPGVLGGKIKAMAALMYIWTRKGTTP